MARAKQELPLFIPQKADLSRFSVMIPTELQELLRKYKGFLREKHAKDYSIDEISTRILETVNKDALFKKWVDEQKNAGEKKKTDGVDK
jgi:hypothetical protein